MASALRCVNLLTWGGTDDVYLSFLFYLVVDRRLLRQGIGMDMGSVENQKDVGMIVE